MTNENSNNNVTRRDDSRLIAIAILAPVVLIVMVILVKAGGPAIWAAIKAIWAAIFPNFWVVIVYAYIGFVCWVLGRRSRK